jgi:hypothetical protein
MEHQGTGPEQYGDPGRRGEHADPDRADRASDDHQAVAAVPVGRPSADRCDEAGDQCEDGQQRSGLGGDVASAG